MTSSQCLYCHFEHILGISVYRGILPNIYDETFCENSQQFKAVNCFCKIAPSLMFAKVSNLPMVFTVEFEHVVLVRKKRVCVDWEI